jgi:hypothetical protein
MFATTVFLQIAEYKELRIGPEKRRYRNMENPPIKHKKPHSDKTYQDVADLRCEAGPRVSPEWSGLLQNLILNSCNSAYRSLFGKEYFISLEGTQVYTCAYPRGQIVNSGFAIDGLDAVHEEN